MKLNLITSTPDGMTFEQLKEASDGVYICLKHHSQFPQQRIVKNGSCITCINDPGTGSQNLIRNAEKLGEEGCRFVLAPEQVINITFSKE